LHRLTIASDAKTGFGKTQAIRRLYFRRCGCDCYLLSLLTVKSWSDITPDFEEYLEQIYGTPYSSLAHFRALNQLQGASMYVSHSDNNTAITLLLFRIENDVLSVMNEGMSLHSEEIEQFAAHIFSTCPTVRCIRLNGVQVHGSLTRGSLRFRPQQRFFCTEDFCLQLPQSENQYQKALGPATRKNLGKHMTRLVKAFPSFEFRLLENTDIRETDIRQIVLLNSMRMHNRGIVPGIDENEFRRYLALARSRGFVGVARIDGKVCAGAIAFRVGDHVHSRVTAYDPTYDNYRLGTICCYRIVCSAIEHKAKQFHFGPGRYDYKVSLLGTHVRFETVCLYRSLFAVFGFSRLAARTCMERYSVRNRIQVGRGRKSGRRAAKPVDRSWYYRATAQEACTARTAGTSEYDDLTTE
jgi:hypothetical protein